LAARFSTVGRAVVGSSPEQLGLGGIQRNGDVTELGHASVTLTALPGAQRHHRLPRPDVSPAAAVVCDVSLVLGDRKKVLDDVGRRMQRRVDEPLFTVGVLSCGSREGRSSCVRS
jgi:hypothetical protein